MSRLHQIFFDHPWLDDGLPSLGYEETSRKLVGCLGVMPRPMLMHGRPIQAAITHTFMVAPRSPEHVGVELIRRSLAGRQDLMMAQGTSLSRRIFEALGSETSLVYSLGWTRILRPSRYALAFLERRGLPAAVAGGLAPLCRAADAVAGLGVPNPFRLSVRGLAGEELDAETWEACLAEFPLDRALRPAYDTASLKWLLELLAHQSGDVALRKIVVRDSARENVGCYLYYAHPGRVGEVVQIATRPDSMAGVLDHLFCDAYAQGLMALSGQPDPRSLPALGAKHCLFDRGDGSWLLAGSKHRDLLAAIHRGDAFLTRLEAEWWIRFALTRSVGVDPAKGQT